MTGLQASLRISVSIGSFSGTGGSYAGRVGSVGNVGYTVSDVSIGDLLYTGKAFYEITSTTVIQPDSIIEIGVDFIAGTDASATPPNGTRGQITATTPNLQLPLFTQTGSNFLNPEQQAKLLTHAMILIDAIAGESTYGEYLSDEDADADSVPDNATYTLANGNDYGMPEGILKKKIAI